MRITKKANKSRTTSVLCTLYSVICTLLSVLCNLYSVICHLSSVLYPKYSPFVVNTLKCIIILLMLNK